MAIPPELPHSLNRVAVTTAVSPTQRPLSTLSAPITPADAEKVTSPQSTHPQSPSPLSASDPEHTHGAIGTATATTSSASSPKRSVISGS